MRETCALWAKCGLVCLMILAAAGGMNSGRVAAQSSDPSTLPLLSSDGLQYVGGFRLPAETATAMISRSAASRWPSTRRPIRCSSAATTADVAEV